ncbi:MAG: T9SS type A sorting domain-containing protein [Candidatus Kapaibacterium sp.]
MKKFIVAAITVLILNTILLSENCQSQWASYSLPYTGLANTLGFYDLNHGVSFGHTFSTISEKIFYTTNSGINWIHANYPPELRAIVDVQYINSNTIYACGAENIPFSNFSRANNDFILYPIIIRDKLIRDGIEEFSVYKGAFINSTDGGLNWQRASQFDTSTGYVVDINFFNASTGYSLIQGNFSAQTKFCKTTNAGANWQLVKQFDTSYVDKMIFFDMNTGIARGINWQKRIYKTTNAGVNWDVTNMADMISNITFFNSTTGIAIGNTETGNTINIYKTTNTGGNWTIINTFTGNKIYNNLMSLPNTGTAFAIGNNIDTAIQWIDKITTLKTTNYGLNWVSKDFNPKLLAYGLSLVDANNFFIGAGETNIAAQILKSTNGGNVFVNQIGTVVPSKYSLGQNYPNPFNPVTKIRFDVQKLESRSQNSEVTLKIFDITGKEVATLVNERLQPGTYETTFDGSGLNSGVYFYRMVVRHGGSSTDGFSETKRMLLIK